MVRNLLDYWYSIEFFQPCWPKLKKEERLEKITPWSEQNTEQDKISTYDVYFGEAIVHDLIIWVMSKINVQYEDSEIEKDYSKTCVFAFKVDDSGVYMQDSFAVSSFVWAIGRIAKAKSLYTKLDYSELNKLQQEINDELIEDLQPFSASMLNLLFKKVCDRIFINVDVASCNIWVREKAIFRKRDGTFPDIEPSTELISSFFLKDITQVMENHGKIITQYVDSRQHNNKHKILIDSDIYEMKKWLSADKFPLGTWPSTYSASLMQQLAINISISNQDIFSVNGPPGTGKTTLIKEIIVSNIVKRAEVLANFSKPDDAFTKMEFESPPNDYSKTYYVPDSSVTDFAMLVASNNNAAVENISIELPKEITKSKTNYFSDTSNTDTTYFSDVASAMLEENSWGLISARLGKKENINKLKETLWFSIKKPTIKKYYDDDIKPDWQQAKDDFLIALKNVNNERQKIRLAQDIYDEYCKASKNSPSRFSRKANAKKLKELESKLEFSKDEFGKNFADENYWNDITSNEESQSACPWTYPRYDELREELFYRALMLHKAFVLGSNSVKQNISRLINMWDNAFTQNDRKAAYASLLNTLFLLIPVVSATFASIETFLDGIQQGELAMVIIDEAGQATPQSALGALWRTRRAIIVGDPLQVEPIMKTPIELSKRFANNYKLSGDYKSPELSVQILADAQNRYGGFRKSAGNNLWLGCPLVVHRRCIEPMFKMSNTVAYEGRMFCKTQQPSADKKFLLEKSTWFDISGKEVGNKDHTVPAQVDLVVELIQKAVAIYGDLPDIYIITPFTSIKKSIEARLRFALEQQFSQEKKDSISSWLKENCGTIHTFQGKEASEVLLVLGCDNYQGKGAAEWVGKKPNIINVAVSRAKYRIGIIGDYKFWQAIPTVKTICNLLEDSVTR